MTSVATLQAEAPSVAVEVQRLDPWQVMDQWDDEAIIAALQGSTSGRLAYRFKADGKTVVGLGKEGVDLCCEILLTQGHVLRELETKFEMLGEGVSAEALFTAKAGRFAVGVNGELCLDTVIGHKRQPLYRPDRDGNLHYNTHWYEQGAQKALRNARLRLLPLRLREFVLANVGQDGKLTQAPATPATAADGDPAHTPSSDAQRKLYAQLLSSHHVLPDERERALKWLAARRHSVKTLGAQIDALYELIKTREAREKQETKAASPSKVSKRKGAKDAADDD